jgi:hypothetical protein
MSPNKLLIIISLLIVLALGGFTYVGYLTIREYKNWKNITNELAIANRKSDDISLLKQNVEQSRDNLSKLDNSFVSNNNIVVFLESLEKLGRDAGVKLIVNNAESGDRMRISFRVQGTFANIYLFTAMLEKFRYQVSIDNLNLNLYNQDNGKNASWMGDYTITVLSYQKQ